MDFMLERRLFGYLLREVPGLLEASREWAVHDFIDTPVEEMATWEELGTSLSSFLLEVFTYQVLQKAMAASPPDVARIRACFGAVEAMLALDDDYLTFAIDQTILEPLLDSREFIALGLRHSLPRTRELALTGFRALGVVLEPAWLSPVRVASAPTADVNTEHPAPLHHIDPEPDATNTPSNDRPGGGTGPYARVVMSGEAGPDRRDGGEALFVYLSTLGGAGHRAHRTMPLLAEALGLDPRPNSMTEHPGAGARLTLASDRRIRLETGDGARHFEGTVDREFVRVATAVAHVVLIVSYLPLPSGVDPSAHIDHTLDQARCSSGRIPLVV
ncbi:hypothetical protein B4N89_40950 [Embleya scabrispora]|uniref:Uncharacterized protein n=1 Tax=Embleya scabrispora TaxID=159449 RepID=A0A1T3NJF7_9ACTN|nr:hypothetical protein [Embleya scabrispora]OPC76962.1 hypothetical protein B4N89_40950 [Embleya scabrispora]